MPHRIAPVVATLTMVTLLAATAARLGAQDSAPAPRPVHRQALSVQPVFVTIGMWSAEYERAVGGPWTTALGVTYLGTRYYDFWQEGEGSEDQSLHVNAIARLYIDRSPFHGLSLVTQGGVVRDRGGDIDSQDPADAWRLHPSAGLGLEYSGTDRGTRRILLGTGVGYTHIFVRDRVRGDRDQGRDAGGLTLRLSVGYLF